VHSVATLFFTSHRNLCNYADPKTHFPEPKRANSDFSSSNFTVQDHILSTGGALQMLFITSKCLTMSDEKPYSFAESSQTFTPKTLNPKMVV
jgi:hypothetical protein